MLDFPRASIVRNRCSQFLTSSYHHSFNSAASLQATEDGIKLGWPIGSVEPSEAVWDGCEVNPDGAVSNGYWLWGELSAWTDDSVGPIGEWAGGWLPDEREGSQGNVRGTRVQGTFQQPMRQLGGWCTQNPTRPVLRLPVYCVKNYNPPKLCAVRRSK